jgi:hypothetical protein
MQRQITVRGRTQPLFRSLPDKSLMLRSSERPPMYYMALGKVCKSKQLPLFFLSFYAKKMQTLVNPLATVPLQCNYSLL